jgi:hypothetical protein
MIFHGWTWAAARCRGVMHAQAGGRLQDASVCFAPSDLTLVAAVCDGAGGASHGGQGAWLTCRAISQAARRHFAAGLCLPEEAVLAAWVRGARERVAAAAARRQLTPRDFAATLVLAITTSRRTMIAHVGDGAVVARDAQGAWKALSWPEHGEYAAMTYFVTDETPDHVRICRHSEEVTALALFSDGIERLALDFATQQPHGPFFAGIVTPVDSSEVQGRDRALSQLLQRFLDSEAVNRRTQDDKTLILAARR